MGMLCHVNVVRAWLFLCLVVLCRNGILGIVVVVSPVHTRTLLQKVFGRLVLHAWHVRYFARMYVANLHRLGTSSSLAALLNPEQYKARIYILEQFHQRRQDGGALQHQYGIRRLCTVVCFEATRGATNICSASRDRTASDCSAERRHED